MQLEGQVMRRPLRDADRDPVVLALCRRFHSRQLSDAVAAVRPETGAPRRAEERVIAIGEARDVIALRVVVLGKDSVVRDDFLFPRNAAGERPWIAEVAIE